LIFLQRVKNSAFLSRRQLKNAFRRIMRGITSVTSARVPNTGEFSTGKGKGKVVISNDTAIVLRVAWGFNHAARGSKVKVVAAIPVAEEPGSEKIIINVTRQLTLGRRRISHQPMDHRDATFQSVNEDVLYRFSAGGGNCFPAGVLGPALF
jgi:hypothetical protein